MDRVQLPPSGCQRHINAFRAVGRSVCEVGGNLRQQPLYASELPKGVGICRERPQVADFVERGSHSRAQAGQLIRSHDSAG